MLTHFVQAPARPSSSGRTVQGRVSCGKGGLHARRWMPEVAAAGKATHTPTQWMPATWSGKVPGTEQLVPTILPSAAGDRQMQAKGKMQDRQLPGTPPSRCSHSSSRCGKQEP